MSNTLAYGIPCAVEGERGTDFQQRDAGRIAEDLWPSSASRPLTRERFRQASVAHTNILAAKHIKATPMVRLALPSSATRDHAAAVSQKKVKLGVVMMLLR